MIGSGAIQFGRDSLYLSSNRNILSASCVINKDDTTFTNVPKSSGCKNGEDGREKLDEEERVCGDDREDYKRAEGVLSLNLHT